MKKRFEYKGKKYVIFQETKMKLNSEWVDCVIYQTLYDNPDGEFWVRSTDEFFNLFKTVEGDIKSDLNTMNKNTFTRKDMVDFADDHNGDYDITDKDLENWLSNGRSTTVF